MTIATFDELVSYTSYYTGSGASKGYYSGDADNLYVTQNGQSDCIRILAALADADNLYVTQNGQGVVSIQTSNTGGGLVMNGKSESGSYTPSTSFGQQMNPHSRYYYNLYSIKSGTSNADWLMGWGARWYAHSSIQADVS